MASKILEGVTELIRKDGTRVKVSDLDKVPVTALYFSAHWCPPCRAFTPVLSEFYEEVNDEDDGSEFEVVFISSDDDEAAAHKYLQEMHANWLMLPYDAPLRQELKRKLRVFGAKEQDAIGDIERVGGLPTLAVIKKDGSVLTMKGEDGVRQKGPAILNTWRKEVA